jgi:hypothetical protein
MSKQEMAAYGKQVDTNQQKDTINAFARSSVSSPW